ncbi:MAG: hypothetical protein KGJ86_14630 [Chloroflexota bacterium]|nr:hypothetical protein [Chloroflexota bacterium]
MPAVANIQSMLRVYLDTAALSSLIEKKIDPETEAVRELLRLGREGAVTPLHSGVVDSWLWGGRAEGRKAALQPELDAARAEDVSSSLPIAKFSASALQKLTGEQKGHLYPQITQAYARWFYQRSEIGLIVHTLTASQHQADLLATPEAAKWPRFVPANIERIALKENGRPLIFTMPSKALERVGSP